MSRLELNAGYGEEIIDQLAKQGLVIQKHVELDMPTLPPDISAIGDEDLMSLFSKLSAFSNFLEAQLACAQIDERRAEKELETTENLALLDANTSKTAKDTVTLLKAKVASDPQIKKLTEAYEAKYAYRKLIEVMCDNTGRDTVLVSRELTRRTSGFNAQTRGNRMFA